jgi:hypothetical protein
VPAAPHHRESLPLTANGKVDKNELARLAATRNGPDRTFVAIACDLGERCRETVYSHRWTDNADALRPPPPDDPDPRRRNGCRGSGVEPDGQCARVHDPGSACTSVSVFQP